MTEPNQLFIDIMNACLRIHGDPLPSRLLELGNPQIRWHLTVNPTDSVLDGIAPFSARVAHFAKPLEHVAMYKATNLQDLRHEADPLDQWLKQLGSATHGGLDEHYIFFDPPQRKAPMNFPNIEELRPYLRSHIQCWMRSENKEPSEAGYRTAYLLNLLLGGLHHVDYHQAYKSEWDNPQFISLKWQFLELATFDFNLLTRLVFLAHDLCIRVSVRPSGKECLLLVFHPRNDREGDMSTRHSTLDQAITDHRAKKR